MLGRFIQPDTIVPNPANPQDLNRFSYVRNNPLRYTDPTGHRVCEDYQGQCISESQMTRIYNNQRTPPTYTPTRTPTRTPTVTPTVTPTPTVTLTITPTNSTTADPITLPTPTPIPDDGGPITDLILSLPGSVDLYNTAAIAFDIGAWFTDLYAAGAVTYAGIYGAGLGLPGTPVVGPAAPTVTGLTAIVVAELYVQPILTVGNVLASFSTAATIIADTKVGNTRIENGVFSSSVSNSFTLTAVGWANKEAYLSLIIQTTAVSNDFGWTSLPFEGNP